MTHTKGQLLVATPLLRDPNFERTVVLMLEHADEGGLGLVLNRPSPLEMAEPLPDWARFALDPAVIFMGGPVSPSSVIALARRVAGADLDEEVFTPLFGDLGVLDLTADDVMVGPTLAVVRAFSGYTGWAPEQLESEIDEGAWFVVAAEEGDILSSRPENLWRDVLRRQEGPERRYALYPDDPGLN